ncbi:hypothetical protein FACS1894195_2940 [Bacteroidia bacterium]|nr:hypothetical protein FACS1894195_2940 [Bacteroidia bacterium]
MLCDVLLKKHEISVYGIGGMLSAYTDNRISSVSAPLSPIGKIGGGIGIGYTFFYDDRVGFTDGRLNNIVWQWGVTTGLELAFYGSTSYAASYLSVADGIYRYLDDEEEEERRFKDYTGYSELQNVVYAHIPLMATVCIPVMKKHHLYFSAGGKVGFALPGSFTIEPTSVRKYGYYSWTDQTFENMPNHDYGTYYGEEAMEEGNLNFPINVMASIEGGMRWSRPTTSAIYTGAFIDYGISGIWGAGLKVKWAF